MGENEQERTEDVAPGGAEPSAATPDWWYVRLDQPWATEIQSGVWAVQLTDSVDWEVVANWVGGEVVNTRDHCDEYTSHLVIRRTSGQDQVAHEDWWVIRNKSGGRHVATPCVGEKWLTAASGKGDAA